MWKSKLPEQCRYRRRVNPQTHSSLSLLAIKQRAWSVQISSAPGFHAEFITRLAIKLQSSDPRSILLLLQNCQEFINLDTKSKVAHWFQLFKEYSFFGQGNSQWPCASIKWFEMARAYSISLVLLWISSQRDIYGLASWNKTILSQYNYRNTSGNFHSQFVIAMDAGLRSGTLKQSGSILPQSLLSITYNTLTRRLLVSIAVSKP